jgi:CubicO group peptidase (beta-lactamase class C family)
MPSSTGGARPSALKLRTALAAGQSAKERLLKTCLHAMLCTLLCACALPSAAADSRCVAAAGETFDAAGVQALFDDLERDPAHDLRGVVVMRHGCVQVERYFNGDGPQTLRDIRSAAKSITATLVGIAIDRRLITGVDEPIGRLLPPGMPPAQQGIRLRDLLTMRSGLDCDDDDPASLGNENRLDDSPAWLPFAYAVPMKHAPGERYVYSSLNAFLAGAVVEHVSGMPLQRFAQQQLFTPLGITQFSWRRGPKGEGVGQGNLSLSTRDMARIGQLFLDGGKAGGRQVVPRAWVSAVTSPLVGIAAQDPYADSYGYMWYTKQYERGGRPLRVHFASGNGGNKIYFVPALDFVVAITSTAYGRGYGQRRSEQILLRLLDATDVRR